MPPKPKARLANGLRDRERNPDGTVGEQDPETAKRVIAARFQPGRSGCPGGMRKEVAQMRDRISELTDGGQDILKFMANVMKGTEAGMEDERCRIAAAVWLGDRFYGKAKQTIELQSGPGDPQQPSTPPLRDLLMALDEKDRGDLERILTNFERARSEGRLMLPAAVSESEDPETPN